MLASRRLPHVPVIVGLVLAVLVASPAPAAREATPQSKLIAHLFATTHAPKAGNRWPIRITARDTKWSPVRGTVRYAFLYQGQVVLRLNPKVDKRFVGDYRDRHLAWSKRTIGLDSFSGPSSTPSSARPTWTTRSRSIASDRHQRAVCRSITP